MANATTTPPATKPYKAIWAFVLTFVSALVATLQGREEIDSTRLLDWIIIVGGALVTGGGTYAITNPRV